MSRRPYLALGLALLASSILQTQVLFAAEDSPSYIKNDTLVVARVGSTNTFAAYSKHSGAWTTHKFADGLEVTPVIGKSVVAFYVSGDSVAELVAIDQNGKWRAHPLPNSDARTCTPVIGSEVAAFSIGDVTYAFSGRTGAWAAITHSAQAQVGEDTAMIVTSDRISVFSAETGSWAESPILAAAE